MLHDVSLADRFDLTKRQVLLGGTQALVRALLMQKARDEAAGLSTAGYATGYRGSPLGGLDLQMMRAERELAAADVTFEPGLNEDLAATALWGSQQAALRGEGRVDGVFGLWYGKGPGVDRCGDVFRHANMAGTAALGGVLAALGDDHTGESSTTLHHSEFALVDAMMPILSPAGVQEVLDYALLGWALSRYSGAWVGLKCVKDTIEVTEVVDGDPHRLRIVTPTDFAMPEGGLNIRLGDTPVAQEARMHDFKRFSAEAFARANRIDRRVWGDARARIGIVSCGKSWLDTVHALELLGLDAAQAARLGISTYKIGMVWPLDMKSFREWAHDLELIIVVEEKRKLLEVEIKEAIFDDRRGRRVIGWKNERGETVFSVKAALDPVRIAHTLGGLLAAEGVETETLAARRTVLDAALHADNAEEIAVRKPWFCSGCPHNTSTLLPGGARAYAGIGCHYMVQWMDRATEGFTHMGGEGANWIGEAPFSTRPHVFQNLGDGTYNHSGVQAIRAALAAGTTITYKILFNDAVAMTGGQPNEGGLSPQRIARELEAMGVGRIVVVYDPKESVDFKDFPSDVKMVPRDGLDAVQRELQAVPGVSAIIYIQTCAAEKRRRRKRGTFPDPDRRVFINPDVCEGCGDCGVQSNCVSILPLETEFGRKRAIDQSSCNKDYSCLKGFCPSFVTLEGAEVRARPRQDLALPDLPAPPLPAIRGTYNIVVTGVGGTGVVTIGALLAMAAHLEGKGAGVMEMAGLAQKGGAVHIHCRIAGKPADISAIRVAVGEADALIGGDLVVSAGTKTLGLLTRGRSRAVVNSHEIVTGQFTRDRGFRLPTDRLTLALRARLGDAGLVMLDATRLAEVLTGDAVHANVLMLGAAWQSGLVPLGEEAILRAIEINGADPEGNKRAFALGRWAVLHAAAAAEAAAPPAPPRAADLDTIIARRADHLAKYQDARLARRYRDRIARARELDEDFASAMARGYHKLLAYKDEYEVARLHSETLRAAVDAQFASVRAMRFHLAPPILGGLDADRRPKKREFGPWMLGLLGLLARMKRLRGTALDPFGRTAERRLERALIAEYEADMDRVQAGLAPETRDIAIELASLPLEIRGFGPVKARAAEQAAGRRRELLEAFEAGGWPRVVAAE
ncbi:MAG TPA: indolepyruvate ferredoxin oxidoreductase family protein [Amaricoccus sp.]|uniref:indolepyruvate ferredoxin oxidoreductase family protein n=2 Tax=Amaricoccus sp. TaxID=1872485 RepID=UPI002B64BE81|nr:indolepyruvate ferredoxin oxidoreductase family protein [Amaricoccus sp.]HMR51267.1 indolepyruvate ferredoxin oxidoreductase family protein [Amaricoccus sp.]HMR60060.1 indolepyruvate ferredoxin oxidoreductase family protein [Amaricoccus sp.]HMT97983.1 indolepyruvate ferredoxin oxidoreductase family protein [Amaricoccus sp.]